MGEVRRARGISSSLKEIADKFVRDLITSFVVDTRQFDPTSPVVRTYRANCAI